MSAIFFHIANQIGVNVSLLISLCTVESGLRNVNNFTDANGRGSYGICQMSVNAARDISPHLDALALQQIHVNVKTAGLYLKKLQRRYGEVEGIAAYNYGSVKKNEQGFVNKRYVEKVQNVYYDLEGEKL